ncbi:hypothetical protein B0H11DRAFT_2383026 [Mycena galericulata]|nr:hypothetical protein B0H11DRAFT_2383026 [Mycena galericulata]
MTSCCSKCGAFTITKVEEFDLTITAGKLARHSKLLNSNEPPGSPELAYIRSIVSKTGSRLACLDDEISRLKGQLKQLEEEQVLLSEYYAQNTAIVSPLRRMPPEILGEIFSRTLPSRALNVRDSPWVLTQVCKRWRAVSILMPSLWSRVHIDFSKNIKYPLTMIETHIERARTLKIHFYGRTNRDSHPQKQMFKFLSTHSSRWEELVLHLTAGLVPHLSALENRLPVLRRLWVQWDSAGSQNGVDSLRCFETAYSLVDVFVFSEYRFIPIVLPPHNRITRYDIDAPWDTHRAMLKLIPDLVEARVRVNFDNTDPWPDSGETIQLLHLRRLDVSHVEILDYLSTPVLEDAALNCTEEEDTDFYTLLVTFLIRSSCPLRRLCIRGSPDPHAAAAVLQKISSVTELAILITNAASQETETFRTLLTILDGLGGAWVSPQLSEIHFGFDGEKGVAIDYPLYLRMLQSRWKSAACALKGASLLTRAGPCPDSETLCRLEELMKEGLDISLLSGSDATTVMDSWSYSTQTWGW